jgi:hypothetical protein
MCFSDCVLSENGDTSHLWTLQHLEMYILKHKTFVTVLHKAMWYEGVWETGDTATRSFSTLHYMNVSSSYVEVSETIIA